MKDFNNFVKANREKIYSAAKRNTVYNSNGDATISRDDSWFYDDVWDKDFKELVALEEHSAAGSLVR